jgi:hypothetical protein
VSPDFCCARQDQGNVQTVSSYMVSQWSVMMPQVYVEFADIPNGRNHVSWPTCMPIAADEYVHMATLL